jgi:hypothetical protein
LSLRPCYPLPSNLLFNTCFTTSSSLSSSLSPSFSILTPSLIPPRHLPYFIPLISLLHPHHLFTILPPSYLSFSLYSFLPALFLIPVSCAFQHLANLSFSHLH